MANGVNLHLSIIAPFVTIFSAELVYWTNAVYSLALVQKALTTSIWFQGDRLGGLNGMNVLMLMILKDRGASTSPVQIIIERGVICDHRDCHLIVVDGLRHNRPGGGLSCSWRVFKLYSRDRKPINKVPRCLLYFANVLLEKRARHSRVGAVNKLNWKCPEHQNEPRDMTFERTFTVTMNDSTASSLI